MVTSFYRVFNFLWDLDYCPVPENKDRFAREISEDTEIIIKEYLFRELSNKIIKWGVDEEYIKGFRDSMLLRITFCKNIIK